MYTKQALNKLFNRILFEILWVIRRELDIPLSELSEQSKFTPKEIIRIHSQLRNNPNMDLYKADDLIKFIGSIFGREVEDRVTEIYQHNTTQTNQPLDYFTKLPHPDLIEIYYYDIPMKIVNNRVKQIKKEKRGY